MHRSWETPPLSELWLNALNANVRAWNSRSTAFESAEFVEVTDRAEGLDFETDPDQPYVAPDDYVEDDFGAFYTDENTLASERVLPFEDSGREAGIASLYGQGPQFGTTNRRYENEYRDFLASQSDTMRQFGPITYEEFADAYERMYQGKPQIGFR